jgi:hypothetical protein
MSKPTARGILALLTFLALTAAPILATAAEFRSFGKVDRWQVTGQPGHCQIGRGLEAGQIQFILSPDGTVITLQSLRWTGMRQPRSNVFTVTLFFDGKKFARADALVIVQVRAFQIFLLDAEDPVRQRAFWQTLARSRTMSVAVPFQSQRLKFDIAGTTQTYALMRKCVKRYLKGTPVPF